MPPLPAAAQRQVEKAAELMRPAPTGVSDEVLKAKEAELAKAKTDLEASERRYAVLKGKYDAEVPPLQAQVKTLTSQTKDLSEAANRKFAAGEITSLDAGERELMGERMITAATKIATETIDRVVSEKLKPVNERMDKFSAQTEAAYFATLDRYLPLDWEKTLNNDPALMQWLQGVDPGTKQIRHALLKRAEAGWQGYIVVDILSAFLQGREIGARESATPPKTPPLSPPEGGGSPPPSGDPAKRKWTRAEIQQFFRVKRTAPQYQGEEGLKLARATELDIVAAQSEGRITA